MEWAYKQEFYRDEYCTLAQMICVSKIDIELTRGYALTEARKKINPNLKIRYRVEYLNEKLEPIEINYYDDTGYCYKTERKDSRGNG